MMEAKIVQSFGNGGHIVLPKEYVGRRIRFVVEPKRFEDIKSEVLETLKPYLESILGVYLYGSYARNEQTIDSDIDIFVVASTKLKIIDKINAYSFVSATIMELESILKSNAVLLLPILKEAKTIINPSLLEKYKECEFTNENTKQFIDKSVYALELDKKGLGLNIEIGSIVYSLMLRIRGLLMIQLMLDNKLYSKASLFSYLYGNGFSKNKIEELYKIYSKERNGIKVIESEAITKEDAIILLSAAKDLLKKAARELA